MPARRCLIATVEIQEGRHEGGLNGSLADRQRPSEPSSGLGVIPEVPMRIRKCRPDIGGARVETRRFLVPGHRGVEASESIRVHVADAPVRSGIAGSISIACRYATSASSKRPTLTLVPPTQVVDDRRQGIEHYGALRRRQASSRRPKSASVPLSQ